MVAVGPPNPALRNKTYSDVYNDILVRHRRSPASSASSVVILVAPDVDALCAAKMMADLFRQDDVLHRIIPVSGMAEFERWRVELMNYKELHTLLMLNMGAILDLPSDEWFGLFNDKMVIHVIDSNRPQNLSTLFGSGNPSIDARIILWDDGGVELMQQERKAWESVLYDPDPEESDSDDDESDFLVEDDDGEHEADDQNAEEDGLTNGESSHSRKRGMPETSRIFKRQRQDKALKRQEERTARQLARQERIRNERIISKHYTSGTWYGQSVAGTVYTLATLLERVDNDMLWLAIVGLTFQFVASRISRDRYEQYQHIYNDEVARLNQITSENAVPVDFEGLRSLPELRFTLLRHWSLYDAMTHSSYVANKLSLWKERGRRRLVGLFAKMGYSIPEAQQSYQRISSKNREELNERLDQIAPEYGLVDFTYPSFVRHFGFQRQPIGAADMVEALSALLDVGGRVRLQVEEAGSRNGGEWFSGGKVLEVGTKWRDEETKYRVVQKNENSDPDEVLQPIKPLEWWVKNFWNAFDALTEIRKIYEALFLSMSIHRAIIREGCAIIDKQQIKTMNRHRVVVLTQGPDLELLAQPGTLSRLALWLVDAHRDRIPGTHFGRGKKKSLPFVIACLDQKAESYLVVGVTAALEYGDVRKNPFGLAFLDAKERCNARTRHGSFDTSVLEVDQADLTMFLQALCNNSER